MKRMIFALCAIGLLTYSFNYELGNYGIYEHDHLDELTYSSNPPLGKTGAPTEGNCTDCHTGTTQSAAGTVTYAFSGVANEYQAGQTYTIDLSVASGNKNGFEMTILDAADNAAGTFTAGANSSTGSFAGREYIRQSVSSSINSWSFSWEAPATDVGDLTVYYAFNKTNANGSTSGDEVFLGQETISSSSSVSMTDYELLQSGFTVKSLAAERALQLNYRIIDASSVEFSVLDLSGKLIERETLGTKFPGKHNTTVSLKNHLESGVYIVSLLVNNYALNQKVYIP